MLRVSRAALPKSSEEHLRHLESPVKLDAVGCSRPKWESEPTGGQKSQVQGGHRTRPGHMEPSLNMRYSATFCHIGSVGSRGSCRAPLSSHPPSLLFLVWFCCQELVAQTPSSFQLKNWEHLLKPWQQITYLNLLLLHCQDPAQAGTDLVDYQMKGEMKWCCPLAGMPQQSPHARLLLVCQHPFSSRECLQQLQWN